MLDYAGPEAKSDASPFGAVLESIKRDHKILDPNLLTLEKFIQFATSRVSLQELAKVRNLLNIVWPHRNPHRILFLTAPHQ
jgi:hypothetical protein